MEGLGVDEYMIIEWILYKYSVKVETRFTWFKILSNSGVLLVM